MRRLRIDALLASLVIAGLFVTGCAVGQFEGDHDDVGKSDQWLCQSDDESVECSTATTEAGGDLAAYACRLGDSSAFCPSVRALDELNELPSLLERYGMIDMMPKIPWACLTTGQHQLTCEVNFPRTHELMGYGLVGERKPGEGEIPVETSVTPEQPADSNSGADVGTTPDLGVETGTNGKPVTPRECVADAWRPFFREHANYSYRNEGVDVDFPLDIFSEGGFGALADTGLRGGDGASFGTASASCHNGEQQMRSGVWLEAVLVGCTALNMEILTWCQQAANYAPQSGACNATGTW